MLFISGAMAVRTTGAGGARAPLTSKAGGLSPLNMIFESRSKYTFLMVCSLTHVLIQ